MRTHKTLGDILTTFGRGDDIITNQENKYIEIDGLLTDEETRFLRALSFRVDKQLHSSDNDDQIKWKTIINEY